MTKYYIDYFWKDGIPCGKGVIEEITGQDTFKIVSDPYYKRISIEKYLLGKFSEVIYDSVLLDFRHLKKPEQTAWQKIPISESEECVVCLIRNQDDRVLYIETHLFINSLCRECRVTTPQGILISTHRMYYTLMGDRFDGVILYDALDHPVMAKRYQFDEKENQFTTLLGEEWDMQNPLPSAIPSTK